MKKSLMSGVCVASATVLLVFGLMSCGREMTGEEESAREAAAADFVANMDLQKNHGGGHGGGYGGGHGDGYNPPGGGYGGNHGGGCNPPGGGYGGNHGGGYNPPGGGYGDYCSRFNLNYGACVSAGCNFHRPTGRCYGGYQPPMPPPSYGMWTCRAVDRGFEEHAGGHYGRARDRYRAEREALMTCERFHGQCRVVDCRVQ